MITTVAYPGIQQFFSASATFDHGVTPGTITLTIVPQDVATIAERGDLTFTYNGLIITMADCVADSASYRLDQSGETATINLQDFRWKWRFGSISGQYNVRVGDGFRMAVGAAAGSAFENSERTPQELATLLLEAMEVATFDVTALPNDTRPLVNWDVINPAQALQALVEPLGCAIVPWIDGSVSIQVIGTGATLPADPTVESLGQTVNPLNRPRKLRGVTAPIRTQGDVTLEAVGEDVDGQIKLIDDLSYAPNQPANPGGWEMSDAPDSFEGINDDEKLRLARRTVYRWYRINVSDSSVIEHTEQILPLFNRLVDADELEDGTIREKESFCYGRWHDEDHETEGNTIDDIANINRDNVETDHQATIVTHSFSLDRNRGIVRFSRPVYIRTDDGVIEPADIRLRCSFHLRGNFTGSIARRFYEVDIDPTSPASERIVRMDNLRPFVIFKEANETNFDDIDDEIRRSLDSLAAEYSEVIPTTAQYVGLQAIRIDGAIRTVSWSFNSSGSTTTASWNDDQGGPRFRGSYQTRLRQERINARINETPPVSEPE